MALSRHFIPWDRPLLPQAVERLAKGWDGKGPLDLSDVLVVVPTRQSGRRLREALAAHAAEHGTAVFPPVVMLPESLVRIAGAAAEGATKLESHLAWIDVFRSIALDDFRAVFPVDPPARNFSWARRLAHEFGRLQSTLAEAGLQLAHVIEKMGDQFPEAERWEQIAELEKRHAERLAALGRRDAQVLKLEWARQPRLPDGIRCIMVMGTPDPLPLALSMLAAHAEMIPVEVVVFAPPSEADRFDLWGRPLAGPWAGRMLDLPDFEERVRLCADPEEQAEQITGVAKGYSQPEGILAIGIADSEVLPLLQNALTHDDLPTFNPEGSVRRGDGLFQLLSALAGLARDEAFGAVETLARCPDVLDYLGSVGAGDFSAARFLRILDQLHTDHLPPDLTLARSQAPENRELAVMAEIRNQLRSGRFPENAAGTLGRIFGPRRFRLGVPRDALTADAAGVWTGVMREIAGVAGKFADVTDDEWWELALAQYAETVRYDEKPAGALELQGWLELLWEDAPHLIVAGLNDGRVPEAVVGDPFLPESLRGQLGLKTNGARFARDAYLLQALVCCRSRKGKVDLLLGKTSVAGDPLRPSRLLFRCSDSELATRVALLFRPAEAARSNPPWRRAWKLVPPNVPALPRQPVTGLRAWLACPFRFYLSRVLKLAAVDAAKAELDAMDFGSLCHSALEAMGRELSLRDCTDETTLRDFLLRVLEQNAEARLGAALTLPLLVQLESARQRLSRAAAVQARVRAEGWVIVEVERSFVLPAAGMEITGKIDRVDRHETTGALRVLDYKTSDKPVKPVDAHLRMVRRDETPRAFARFPADEGRKVWADLQLPLYLRALGSQLNAEVTAGYFNLPKASSETGISLWADYTPDLAEAAWRCTEGVVGAIQARDFWPPNEDIAAEYDPFAALFHHGVAESVAWEAPSS